MTLAITSHEEEATITSELPWDAIPADVFWNDSEIQFVFTSTTSAPTHYIGEEKYMEW
jgi:hypothetical protein